MSFVPAGPQIGGYPLYIELEPIGPPGTRLGPKTASATAPELLTKLELAGAAAGQACVALYQKLHEEILTIAAPSEVSVEFGITLGGEAGIPFVAKGTVEAAFKVTAKWTLSGPAGLASGAN